MRNLCFRAKNLRSCIFYLLAHPAETAYLSFRDRELSNDVRLVQLQRRKVVVHTFLGWSQAGLLRRPLYRYYRKPLPFNLTSYPGEVAHLNSANQELYNDIRLVELWRRKMVVHTFLGLSQAGLLRQRSCRNYRKP